MERDLEFFLLGPLEVRAGGTRLPLRSAKQRALLGILLLHANEVVSSDRLIDELWPVRPPESAANVLQVHVSQLRKLLEPGRARGEAGILVTRPPGYVLEVAPERIDAARFERLVAAGVDALASGGGDRALAMLDEALALWRGPALADLALEDFARADAARLDGLRLLAIEERSEALLALGRHAALVPELEALAAEHPARERLAGQLMLALYRTGRQADALDVYSRARASLVDELGIEPGPALQRLEKAILNQDPSLDLRRPEPAPRPPPPAAPPPPAPRAARKTVTVLFAEWGLEPARARTVDAETLEPVLALLHGTLAALVERHGGSVEWARDAEAVAVFGLPRVHEDDALRAVRAAADVRTALAELVPRLERDYDVRAEVRMGLDTGQVIAGAAGASPAVGGIASVAARIGRGAAGGEIRLADATRDLVRDAIHAEPAGEGATEAWRLLEVVAGAAGVRRRLTEPIVGRAAELEALRRAFDAVEAGRSAALVTLLGPAGIGKSHLARAFTGALGDRCRVVVGRCVSYGEGAGLAPLAEIVGDVGGDDAIRGLLADDPDRDVVAEGIAAAVGLSESGAGAETTLWALRKLLEALAQERPLVLVLDDLHWAEPMLLDLVEYVLDWTFDAPVLVLGLARPDLLEERPAWAGGKRNVSSLLLPPLTDAESQALVEQLLGDGELAPARRARIVDAAAGNPLFLEQILAIDAGSGSEVAIPPTIRALLEARLDRLDAAERGVLERASVMGKEFWRDALAELAPDESAQELDASLRALVRAGLIEPCRPAVPAGDALRFHSILIRDAAYESVPKRARATMHERVATWLVWTLGEPAAQYEEVLGYHLEQSFRYTAELGPFDERARAVGTEAARRLAWAGRRAFARGDMAATAGLLRRAAALLPEDDLDRLSLLPIAGEALHETGEFEAARALLDEAVRTAETLKSPRLRAKAALVRALVDASAAPDGPGASLVAEAEAAAALFDAAGDDDGLATAFRMLAWAHGTAGRYGDAAAAAQRAVEHAGRAGDDRQRARAATQYALAALHGPTPVTEAVERCRRIVEEVAGDRRSEGLVTSILGWLEAMRGEFEVARTLASRAREILVDLGVSVLAASTSQESSQIELLAGDAAAAERDLRRDYDALTSLGERYLLSTVACDLAHAVYLQGRLDEALELSRTAEGLADDDDVTSQAFWRCVRAKVEARHGRLDHAVPLATRAVELLRETDDLVALARALADEAEVLSLADRGAAARASLEEAVRLLERKENVAGVRQARALLDRPVARPMRTGR